MKECEDCVRYNNISNQTQEELCKSCFFDKDRPNFEAKETIVNKCADCVRDRIGNELICIQCFFDDSKPNFKAKETIVNKCAGCVFENNDHPNCAQCRMDAHNCYRPVERKVIDDCDGCKSHENDNRDCAQCHSHNFVHTKSISSNEAAVNRLRAKADLKKIIAYGEPGWMIDQSEMNPKLTVSSHCGNCIDLNRQLGEMKKAHVDAHIAHTKRVDELNQDLKYADDSHEALWKKYIALGDIEDKLLTAEQEIARLDDRYKDLYDKYVKVLDEKENLTDTFNDDSLEEIEFLRGIINKLIKE